MSLTEFFTFFFLLLFLSTLQQLSNAQIQQNQHLTSFNISLSPWLPSQNRTLLSPNSTFTAGFFPSPNSPNLFTFSVWFTRVPQTANPVVWSATTQVNSSGSLVLTSKGEILLQG